MQIPNPSTEVIGTVEAGVSWLKSHAIYGQQWVGGRDTPEGRHLTPVAGAGRLWARYYSVETQQPIFGDRDKTIHDNVTDISAERRNGYAWYSSGPQKALDVYASWSKEHISPSRASK